MKPFLDWAFIAGILAASMAGVVALFKDAEAIIEATAKALASRKKRANAA